MLTASAYKKTGFLNIAQRRLLINNFCEIIYNAFVKNNPKNVDKWTFFEFRSHIIEFKTSIPVLNKRYATSYSYMRPYCITSQIKELESFEIKNIFIAGEHTSSAFPQMGSGALSSGLRTAKKILCHKQNKKSI